MKDDGLMLKLWDSIKPMIQAEIAAQTRSCPRMKSMVISTAYDNETGLVGVKEAFCDEIFLPAYSNINTTELTVGKSVWVLAPFSDWSNAIVFMMGSGISADVRLNATRIDTDTEGVTVQDALDTLDDWLSDKASVHRFTAVLEAAEWSGSAPYTQTVSVTGMLDTDVPKMDVVLDDGLETRIEEREAYGCISMIESDTDALIVTCDDAKPEVNLTVQLEVIR